MQHRKQEEAREREDAEQGRQVLPLHRHYFGGGGEEGTVVVCLHQLLPSRAKRAGARLIYLYPSSKRPGPLKCKHCLGNEL